MREVHEVRGEERAPAASDDDFSERGVVGGVGLMLDDQALTTVETSIAAAAGADARSSASAVGETGAADAAEDSCELRRLNDRLRMETIELDGLSGAWHCWSERWSVRVDDATGKTQSG